MARYPDGHAYCFSDDCDYWEPRSGEPAETEEKLDWEPIHGEPKALRKRVIDQETCAKWGYEVGHHNGSGVQIANYYREGTLVAQKVRRPDKTFYIKGDAKAMGLYGQWLWPKGGKMVVVTEGEIDALTVSQLQGNKWPVVSVPNGAGSADKTFRQELDWLESFDRVVIMFDQDKPGQQAASKCAALLSPGRAHIAKLPCKDPNECLQSGRGQEVIHAMWKAEVWRPDGIVTGADLTLQALEPTEWGISWPWDLLTQATYGIRRREVYALGAGTGVGKTDVMTQIATHLIQEHGLTVGMLFLEQPPVETVRRVAGKAMGQRFHVPDGDWSTDSLRQGIDLVGDKLVLYDHFGSTDWESIRSQIRYMVQSLGIKDIFLDHLTALAAHAQDERKALEEIMSDMSQMTQEMGFTLYFVSHLATPDGKPHEEGGRVFIRHFKGSRAIGFWSHFMFALERDQQSTKEEHRHVTTFRILKDRYTGQATGQTFWLKYDQETGLLHATDTDPFAEDSGEEFDDEEAEF